MSKYKNKPVVIDAEVYSEGLEDGWRVYYSGQFGEYEKVFKSKESAEKFAKEMELHEDEYIVETPIPIIKTLEGLRNIKQGDYIITGVKGERYPCKPDIFHMTYEEVIANDEKLINMNCPICGEKMKVRIEEIRNDASACGREEIVAGWDCECGISLDMYEN